MNHLYCKKIILFKRVLKKEVVFGLLNYILFTSSFIKITVSLANEREILKHAVS